MIKKTLSGLVVAGVTVCLALLAGNHYESYQADQTAEDEAVAAAVEEGYTKQIEEVKAELTVAQTESERLLVECQKGEAAYETLTEFQKNQVQTPVCEEQEEEPVEEVIEPEDS